MMRPVTPALTVRADTSIAECIKIMKQKEVGSILVISDDDKEELIGIFTERDLLMKVDLIRKGHHWDKPIRTVMTHPVTTLNLYQIEKAEEILYKNTFRHLPIVISDAKTEYRVIGMVSMRDLFRKRVFDSKGLSRVSSPSTKPTKASQNLVSGQPIVHILSEDPNLFHVISHLNHELSLHLIPPLEASLKQKKSPLEQNRPHLLIFDIDSVKNPNWPERLKQIEMELKPSRIVILYSPLLLAKKSEEIIREITKNGKNHAFPKPLNLVVVSEYINSLST